MEKTRNFSVVVPDSLGRPHEIRVLDFIQNFLYLSHRVLRLTSDMIPYLATFVNSLSIENNLWIAGGLPLPINNMSVKIQVI